MKIASFLFAFFLLPALFAHEGKIELLYFKPTIDQSSYAIKGQNFSNGQHYPFGTRFNNDPSFQPAFRIQGIYDLCENHNLDIRFARFCESHRQHVSGNALFDTIGSPASGAMAPEDTVYTGRATYNQLFHYYGLDFTCDRTLLLGNPERLLFFWGLHFNSITLQENTRSRGTSDSSGAEVIDNHFRRQSQFYGIGPQFGVDYRFSLPCLKLCGTPLQLGTNARVSLLASRTQAKIHYRSGNTGPRGVNLRNQNVWRVTPAFDIKLALSYDHPCSCWKMHYELGYEVIWVHGCIDAITGLTPAYAGQTIDLYSNLNLQGPYVALGISF